MPSLFLIKILFYTWRPFIFTLAQIIAEDASMMVKDLHV